MLVGLLVLVELHLQQSSLAQPDQPPLSALDQKKRAQLPVKLVISIPEGGWQQVTGWWTKTNRLASTECPGMSGLLAASAWAG